MSDQLRRRLEALADRGRPRGAEAVLADARRDAQASRRGPVSRPPLFAAAAIAAAVLAVLGTTAAVVHDDGDQRRAKVAAAPEGDTSAQRGSGVDTSGEAAAGGPTTTTLPTVDLRDVRLVAHSSCRSFVNQARRDALTTVTPYGLPTAFGGRAVVGGRPRWRAISEGEGTFSEDAGTGPASGPSPASGEATAGSSGGPTHSQTNVQEEGIDEPDVVDTDGRRLFTLRGEHLWYSTVDGARARMETSIAVPGAREFVLVGNRAVVFAEHYGTTGASTKLVVVDVATPQMGVVASVVFEGAHVSARVVDGVVRAVVRSEPSPLPWRYPAEPTPAEEQRALAENRKLIRQADRGHWLPDLVVEDGIGRVRASRPLVDCDDTYRPQAFSGLGLLTVVTLDPTNPDATTSTSVQAHAHTVYASGKRLYVATTEWKEGPTPSGANEETLVHAFDITGRGQARYTGSGRVPGTVIGQFAFSEHDDHLRVATTVRPWDGTASESVVTVLRETAAGLEQVGQVGGLGKTEEIYAVRFIGPLGYVVTFRRTDPLYVVDITDPRAPRVVGELKIPGYSSYLHPIGPGLLLGVGQDADENGQVKGLQVSVFDVADPAKPQRLHQQTFEAFSGSSAEADHHAFLWWAPTQLAVLPLSSYDHENRRQQGGAVGLTAGRERLAEVGRITHPGDVPIDRSVVVGSTLFTVSHAGIRAVALADLAPGEWSPYPS